MAASYTLIAFMEDPDAMKPNPIHSTSVARDYGFKAALVGGVTTYGWATQAITDVFGSEWLDHGWAEVRFRRPVYPGDELTITVDDDGHLSATHGEHVCFSGQVGAGDGPWRDEFSLSGRTEAELAPDPRPVLTPETLPLGQDLAAWSTPISVAEAETIARDRQAEKMAEFYGQRPRVHPSWIAGQPIHWLHHSFDFGPSIHAESRIQHVRPTFAGEPYVMSGRCIDTFERKGHRYIACDTALLDSEGQVHALIRHTSVYLVAPR